MSRRFWLGVIYVALIGSLSNLVAIFIKRDKIDENKFPFKLHEWEKNGRVYDRMGIRKWKGKVPDMSRFFKFLMPKKVISGTTSDDLKALIKETCVAEIIHIALTVLSLAVFFICPDIEGVVLYSLCLLGNLPFIFIQRYNRPQYITAHKRLLRREERLKQ